MCDFFRFGNIFVLFLIFERLLQFFIREGRCVMRLSDLTIQEFFPVLQQVIGDTINIE